MSAAVPPIPIQESGFQILVPEDDHFRYGRFICQTVEFRRIVECVDSAEPSQVRLAVYSRVTGLLGLGNQCVPVTERDGAGGTGLGAGGSHIVSDPVGAQVALGYLIDSCRNAER